MAKNQVAHIRSDHTWMDIISECRRSGLTDKEWCLQNNISIHSFYSAIRRLRKKACAIPEHTKASVFDLTAQGQDVVRIDIAAESPVRSNRSLPEPVAAVAMELSLSNIPLRIYNGIDPALLTVVLRFIRSEV